MKKEEKSFEQLVQEFLRKIRELETPPSHNLTEKEFEVLRRDRELRTKSVNYQTLGETGKADAIEKEILNLQDRVAKIKEKLNQAPSSQQEIYNTIASMPDASLHKQALKIQKVGLSEYQAVLKEIEESEEALTELHDSLVKNAKLRGDLERRKFNLYQRLREIEKCLPAEAHKTVFPQRSVEWSHFVPQELEDRAGRAFGRKPYLLRD